MDDPISSNGGGAPQELKPIVITLTLTPTPAGYAMAINHDPAIFPDTVMEACHRALRIYEQVALLQQMQRLQATPRVASEAELRRIVGGLSS